MARRESVADDYEKRKRGVAMPENFHQLMDKYHAFYDIWPYHVVVEDMHGSPTATKRIIQAGFDIDVHGLGTESGVQLPPSRADYASGYTALKKVADIVSHHASECIIEVICFPSTLFFEARRHFQPEAVIRIRIFHRGGDQPAGLPERQALEEVEKQLQGLGIARR